MPTNLPQIYQEVAREVIPYKSRQAHGKMALIAINPALPCVLCSGPATNAIIAPAPEQAPGAWLTFPICNSCEERQVRNPPETQE